MQRSIPFTRPHLGAEERAAVLRALDLGAIGGNGPISGELEQALRDRLGVRYALFTTSCSHALELAAMALGLKRGDEVIMPSFTFVTTASSVMRAGAKPVFVDIDPETFNLDPEAVLDALTPATRAIIPVHYAGHACAMDELMGIARAHGLRVIEDAAQGLGASYRQRALGTIGDAGCFSFHSTKNIVGGEGGAFVTNDERIARKAEIIREKGTNRSSYLRGEVDKYTWVDLGSSFVQSDLVAAIVLAQLDKLEAMHQRRRRIWERYQEGLADLGRRGQIILPTVRPGCAINWHLYVFRVADPDQRDAVIGALRRRGIGATFHFVPLHSSPFARAQWGYRPESLPNTEQVAASLIRLPIFPDLADDDQEFIIDSLYTIMGAQVSKPSPVR